MKIIATEFYQQKHENYLWKLNSKKLAMLTLCSLHQLCLPWEQCDGFL